MLGFRIIEDGEGRDFSTMLGGTENSQELRSSPRKPGFDAMGYEA